MSRTLILPDIHCEYGLAEKIILKESPDKTIFLGDYFDNYDTRPEITRKTASWLHISVESENRIHLIGNHELFYVNGNRNLQCSGNEDWKYGIVKKQNIPWSKFRMSEWVGDYLVTHAGVSSIFYKIFKNTDDFKTWLSIESCKALQSLLDDRYHSFFNIGFTRGGNHEVGGPLWCDINEFKPIKGIKQIFGHTNLPRPWEKYNNNWCIDSKGYYAIYENGELKIDSI